MAEERTQPKIRKIGLAKPIEVRMGKDDEQVFFVILHKDGTICIRPKGSRDWGAVAHTTVKAVYERVMINRAPPIAKTKKVRGSKKRVRRSSIL